MLQEYGVEYIDEPREAENDGSNTSKKVSENKVV